MKDIDKILGAITTLGDNINKINEKVERLSKEVDQMKGEKDRDLVDTQLRHNLKTHTVQAYKVMGYRGMINDSMGGMRKDYIFPGQTFKSYEEAKAFIDANPNGSYDLIPL